MREWSCLKINIGKLPSFTIFTPASVLNFVNIISFITLCYEKIIQIIQIIQTNKYTSTKKIALLGFKSKYLAEKKCNLIYPSQNPSPGNSLIIDTKLLQIANTWNQFRYPPVLMSCSTPISPLHLQKPLKTSIQVLVPNLCFPADLLSQQGDSGDSQQCRSDRHKVRAGSLEADVQL